MRGEPFKKPEAVPSLNESHHSCRKSIRQGSSVDFLSCQRTILLWLFLMSSRPRLIGWSYPAQWQLNSRQIEIFHMIVFMLCDFYAGLSNPV